LLALTIAICEEKKFSQQQKRVILYLLLKFNYDKYQLFKGMIEMKEIVKTNIVEKS